MVRPVSFKGFQKGFQGVSLRGFRGVSDFPLGIMCLYQIPQLRGSGRRKRDLFEYIRDVHLRG